MSAILSPCGLFRFRLEREVLPAGVVAALIGVNPSTADAETNDATIVKDLGFARRNGWRRIIKGNVFPFRATDVRRLKYVVDHRLEENAEHLRSICADADVVVPCWGARAKLPRPLWPQLGVTMALLRATGKPLLTFGMTGAGDPKHPLMLAYSTMLEPLEVAHG